MSETLSLRQALVRNDLEEEKFILAHSFNLVFLVLLLWAEGDAHHGEGACGKAELLIS